MKTRFTVERNENGDTVSNDIDLGVVFMSKCHCCGQRVNPETMVLAFSDGYYVSTDEKKIESVNDGVYSEFALGRTCAKNLGLM